MATRAGLGFRVSEFKGLGFSLRRRCGGSTFTTDIRMSDHVISYILSLQVTCRQASEGLGPRGHITTARVRAVQL